MGPTTTAPAASISSIVLPPVLWFIPGILNKPSDFNSWQDRAVTETLLKTRFAAEKGEYFARPLTRRIGLTKKSRKIGERICNYAGRNVHLIVHSNGGEVARRILRWILQDKPDYVPSPKFASLTFIAPACDADFEKNYLNAGLHAGIIGNIHVLRGGKDFPLKLGRWSKRVFGGIGLGYGDFGLEGPRNVSPLYVQRVSDELRPEFGHGTFLQGAELSQTLAGVYRRVSEAERMFPHDEDWTVILGKNAEKLKS